MDADEPAPPHARDPLGAVSTQDLDRFSVAELEARIVTLEGEIARTRRRLDASVNHRTSADALFRR